MFRLTREVRFAINEIPDSQLEAPPTNSYAGYPSLNGNGRFLRLQVTLQGSLDPDSGYLRNIKEIDSVVRDQVVRSLQMSHDSEKHSVLRMRMTMPMLYAKLNEALEPDSLQSLRLWLSPFLSTTQIASEYPMTRLSQKFEFSAAHRLHNPKLSDEQNQKVYGKCNNPNGHGHNYELQVTLRGKGNENGLLVDVPAFETIVKQFAVDKLDHKHLNLDVPEFAELIPTVENIAMVVYRMLKNRFMGIGADLASVTVWETPKTWCEYTEE